MAKNTPSPLADLQHQYHLLQKEYEYEKETYKQQSEQTGIHKKIQQGLCWYPIAPGKSYYNSLNQLVIEIERLEERETEHNFEYGRPVCFFKVDNLGKFSYLNFSCTISYVQENRMVLVLPNQAALTEIQLSGRLGVQIYFDETSYRAMFNALTSVINAKNNRLAYLRDLFLSNRQVATRTLFPLRFPWLNTSQEEAVNRVLRAKEVAIVHGPPGTGKTTTLVEAIYETLHRENQVIVCAQSNTAVDWVSEKLVDRGISVLRIGNPTRVNDKMLSFTYERRFESHPDYTELWGIRKAIREIQANIRKKRREEKESLRNRLSRLKFRTTELEVKIDTELFDEARVIACTLIGAANRLLMNRNFTTLFIDEAAQALEAACWIPIAKTERVIFAGDHCQLPPTIKCIEAARGGLDHTLMQKIASRKPEVVSLLKVQYRMHNDIMYFPSHWFYHDELLAAPEVKHRGILEFDTPIVWFDTSACSFAEETKTNDTSRINRKEALLLVKQLKSYMQTIGKERILAERIDFGLISPYKAQVQFIRSQIKHDPFFKPLRQLITIHTIDGFQGQERDVIILSLVRANEESHIGFLNDLRRINVAITRARMKLMIIGDASTLSQHPFYNQFYQYVQQKGKVEQIIPNTAADVN